MCLVRSSKWILGHGNVSNEKFPKLNFNEKYTRLNELSALNAISIIILMNFWVICCCCCCCCCFGFVSETWHVEFLSSLNRIHCFFECYSFPYNFFSVRGAKKKWLKKLTTVSLLNFRSFQWLIKRDETFVFLSSFRSFIFIFAQKRIDVRQFTIMAHTFESMA